MSQAAEAPLRGLERGLRVLTAFEEHPAGMSVSDVANASGLPRASAGRVLRSLEEQGFVEEDARVYRLTPRVLRLGWSHLAPLDRWQIAEPLMAELVTEIGETASATVLEGDEIVFRARVAGPQMVTMSLTVGSRLPAYATAMGRVLFAGLPDAEVETRLRAADLAPLTDRTVTDPERLLEVVRETREQGYALVDEELELGLRSLSVPMCDPRGQVVAALNLCATPQRVSVAEMQDDYLPAMQRCAAGVALAWKQRLAA